LVDSFKNRFEQILDKNKNQAFSQIGDHSWGKGYPTHQVKMSLFHTSKWGKRKTKCQRETPTPSLEIVF
jgi:hypothetical protein